jgi:type VII secretion protein EccB
MQTRKDQLQAHKFVVRRATYALLRGEPDSPETPLRTIGLAVIGSIVAFGLVAAGVGIYGVIRPGGKTPKAEQIIVERETGARYVLIDGVLHPTLNYASARLVLGSAEATTAMVSQKSLSSLPRGLPVGIPGAPDTLPGPAALVTAPWAVCAGQGTDVNGADRPTTTLTLGAPTTGTALGTGDAVLVAGPDRTPYLVWGGHRLRLGTASVAGALGYSATEPLPVGDAWLNAVPPGPDLRPPDVPGRGDPGPRVGTRDTRVGQVLTGTGPSTKDSYYLVLADGLASLTPTGAALLLGDPGSRTAYPDGPVEAALVTSADIAAAPRSPAMPVATGLPESPPRLVDPDTVAARSACALYPEAPGPDSVPTLVVGDPPAAAGRTASVDLPPAGGPEAGATGLVDRVWLPPGRAAVVQALPAPGVTTGTRYLVTDLGVRFPVVTEALTTLGYGDVAPTPVPWMLLQMMPAGPPLDAAAARAYQPPLPATASPSPS